MASLVDLRNYHTAVIRTGSWDEQGVSGRESHRWVQEYRAPTILSLLS